MKHPYTRFVISIVFFSVVLHFSSCKSCKKEEAAQSAKTDSTAVAAPVQSINLPHADTTLIPVLSAVLDKAFAASARRDYVEFASLLVYRGPDSLKFGYDVFNARNSYDKTILRITAEVFNKWNKDIDSKDYARVFELPQPDGRSMPVLEVIFVSTKSVDRKFFGFLQIKDEWKIADVTSYL